MLTANSAIQSDNVVARLLPCPFCGGEAKFSNTFIDKPDWGYVGCLVCHASVAISCAKAEAITAWNTRADTTQAAEIASLKEQVEQMQIALERIADPRNTHFAGDAQVVARNALGDTGS